MQRAVLDFSLVNSLNQGAAPATKHTPHPKQVPAEPLPGGAEVGLLPFQRWDAGRDDPATVYCFEVVLPKYLKWLAAKSML